MGNDWVQVGFNPRLNPHVVGRFFRVLIGCKLHSMHWRLNPHVVGRFFRESLDELNAIINDVLIPMWWGGFSEPARLYRLGNGMEVLIPMWWGGFSECF